MGDPHLHLHAATINATFDDVEGKWKAGEFAEIKTRAPLWQSFFHAELAARLRGLGYEVGRDASGHLEIRGLPEGLVAAFSRRTEHIEMVAQQTPEASPEARARLGAQTRSKKVDAAVVGRDLGAVWRAMAGPEAVEALRRLRSEAEARAGRAMPSDDRAVAARRAVEHALRHHFERASVIAMDRLVATALDHAEGRALFADIARAVLARPELIRRKGMDGVMEVTTEEVAREERVLLEWARYGRAQACALAPGRTHWSQPEMAGESAEQQRAAVRQVLESRDWLTGVVGRAGTGKTTLLREVASALGEVGVPLVTVAPTASASRQTLRAEGFAGADTVQALLASPARLRGLAGSVLWVDEAGLLGAGDTARLLAAAQAAGVRRVVLAGDPTQKGSVTRGDALRLLLERGGVAHATLDRIKRQKEPGLLAAVKKLSERDPAKALQMLDRVGAITEAPATANRAALAVAYADALLSARDERHLAVAAVAPTNAEVRAVSAAVRTELMRRGAVRLRGKMLARNIETSWSVAQRQEPRLYRPGMTVRFHQHVPGFTRGERAVVTRVDTDAGLVWARRANGAEASLPFDRAKDFRVAVRDTVTLAAGDRVRFHENVRIGKKPRFDSGAEAVVARVRPDGAVELRDGRVVPADLGILDYAYCTTVDKAQSLTCSTLLFSAPAASFAALNQARAYVGVSRARTKAAIYTDDKQGLMAAAARASDRRLALEMLEDARPDEAETEAEKQTDDVGAPSRAVRRRR